MDDDLLAATRRADRLARSGATVVGISLQACLAGLTVLWALLSSVGLGRPIGIVWTVLAGIGAVVTVVAWIRARRTGTLVPFVVAGAERPVAVLAPARRRELRRQLRRADPVSEPYAGLVRSLIGWQRRSSRAAVPVLLGTLITLLGLSGSIAMATGLGWSLMIGTVAAAAVVTVLARVEARRWTTVLEQAEGDGTGATATPRDRGRDSA
ncbi:hypothetical protein ACTJKO_04240 [Curtobacterium sp. 22159]|uniref:hypothetical protein n=1 Tax=Curtobacterium sp. 22159 TaxID=3453882 RepID=UPI003F86911D